MNTPVPAGQRSRMKRRRWVDVAIIIASVYAFGAAVWAPPEMLSGRSAADVGNTAWMYLSYAIGGALGLGGFILVHKWINVGRALVVLGGLIMLSGFLALRTFSLLGTISIGVTGLVLLAGGFLMGPMPTPEDEGIPR